MKDLTSRQADLTLFFVAFFWGTGFTVTKMALEIYIYNTCGNYIEYGSCYKKSVWNDVPE